MKNNENHSSSIGVVGGGQLAQMLVEAAEKLGIDLSIQTDSKLDPAARIVNSGNLVLAKTKDINGTRLLSEKSQHITFENEWIDIESLSLLEDSGVDFIPSLTSMAPLVNKLSQRKLLNKLDIPGPKWISLSLFKTDDLKLDKDWHFPLMAKSSLGGYDGKGTKVIKSNKELLALINEVDVSKSFIYKSMMYTQITNFINTFGNFKISFFTNFA